MASLRGLKKEIDSLVFELISDCFVYSDLHPDHKPDEVTSIISEAVEFRNDLIARVNNPDGKDNPKIVKGYYKSIQRDLNSGVDKLFIKLSSLTKEKE